MLLIVLILTAALSLSSTAAAVNHAETQIEWIRSKGGFFSPKLEVRRLNQTDPNSPSGVFAAANLAEEETLMTIPRSCILTAGGTSKDICDTARNLMKQRELRDKSDFAPYVNYLFEPQHKGILPSAWSDAGQELIETIIGKEMPPFDVTGTSFEEDCGGSGDPFEEETYLTVVRRSWDDIMPPGFDMCNHRNGHWKNVDSNSVHTQRDITVVALRDIKLGEQLYLSYNECADCDYALTYVLQDIVKDFGFVEQYPRRWRFPFDEEKDLVFEIDEHPHTKELHLTWLSDPPNDSQLIFLRGQRRRLQAITDYVSVQASKLVSDQERGLSLDFYQALMTALEYAVWATDTEEDEEQKECEIAASGDPGTCADSSSRVYDELEEPSDTVKFNMNICDFDYQENFYDDVSYESIDDTKSPYTRIKFEHNEPMKDTCLHLNGFLQTCASFRPHYHEVFVHYPARFVDEVKRIAFIGGGDNMILHEILKYPSLELVVGMELDQTVVRSSFKNLGTQPHFDNEKVQWWFGDGSKSILMLPKEYFGTFDLVLLDLETEVVEMLKVTEDHDIMDAALLLLKKDGVIARNEDWGFGSNKPFTDYSVDLFYVDVPVICHQGITVGSNTVDFLTQTPKDHKIENLYLKNVDEMKDPFDFWYNYRKSNAGMDRLGNKWPEETTASPGVLMILEAEMATGVPLESARSVQAIVSSALKNAGLTEFSARLSVVEYTADGYEIVFILREGYVVVTVWPTHKYCAFDILLWSSFEKQNAAKTELTKAVGSTSSSSYRIVTGGMFGASKEDRKNAGPRAHDLCEQPVDIVRDAPAEQDTINTVLEESSALIQDTDAVVAVLCGEESRRCSGLEVLAGRQTGQKVVAVWTCPGVAMTSTNGGAPLRMFECESDTLRSLNALVEANGKISGLVIDLEAPRAMGQILHKILSNKGFRRHLLTEDHVLLAPALDPSETWRRALLDRFRTDFENFDPAYRAEILFNSTRSSLELGVFSSGDERFYSHLVDAVTSIEKKTGLVSDVQKIQNGLNNYVTDFKPSKTCSHDDYSHSAGLDQWLTQRPLGEQSIFQFAVTKATKSPLSTARFKQALRSTITALYTDRELLTLEAHDNVGDGCVVVALWSEGRAILSWDGRSLVSVNLLEFVDNQVAFDRVFLKMIPSLTVTSRNDLPRGVGRVVNFADDIGSHLPHWAK